MPKDMDDVEKKLQFIEHDVTGHNDAPGLHVIASVPLWSAG
jgi:hypothetical protein